MRNNTGRRKVISKGFWKKDGKYTLKGWPLLC